MLAPGTTVRLKIVRNRREMEIPVVLGEQPPERPMLGSDPEPSVTRALEGVEVADLTPQLRRQLELPPRISGVVVVGVEPGTPAAEAGLRRGDVIQEVNGQAVANVSQFGQALHRGVPEPITR